MHILLTVGYAGRERDVLVTGQADTTLGAVTGRLCALVGAAPTDLYAGSTPLAPDSVLGAPGLRTGCRVQVGAPGPREQPGGLVELRVLSGREAGTRWPLRRGSYLIGRGSDCQLRLRDPLCSRVHALLQVGSGEITVQALASANGTLLDGQPLSDNAAPLARSRLLRIGDTLLGLATSGGAPAITRPAPDGGIQVTRPPRQCAPAEPVVLDWPVEPEPRPPARLALLALAAPIVVGVALALVLRMPHFLLFTLLSPLMMLGAWLSDRRGRRRGRGQDLRDHAAALVRAEAARDVALAADSTRRRHALPDLAELAAVAQWPGQRLWERRPGDADFGTVRLGTGSVPTEVAVRGDGQLTTLWAADLPVALPLATVGVAGLAGPDEPLQAMVRSLVVQFAVLHSPRDLRLLLLAPDEAGAEWAWLRWLPHLRRAPPAADLAAAVTDREAAAPHTLLLIPGAGTQRVDPAVGRLLAAGPRVGVLALCLDRQSRRLPAECRAIVRVTGDVGSRLHVSGAAPASAYVLLDGLSAERAERIARDLAPLRDPGGGHGDPPGRVRLLELLEMPEPSAKAVEAAWAAYGGVPRFLLGHDGRGGFGVDLVRDGPHALVAGTTGAGKSQLLQTLVAGLAAAAPPSALQFVLVDYKGGAAFRECARLPHTSGLVTDLDPHLTRRALRSLAAELTRRERVLAAAGASDLAAYDGPLPRLVIVVDEFAALAQELPDFVGGLVSLAARGRSLGIHLVLATQRPGGAVTPEIRANTALRIALRVTDEGESRDIVDQPGAARISRHTPGRALIRTGTEPATLVQTAWVADRPASEPATATVTAVDWPAPPTIAPRPAGEGDTDLALLVGACREAARARGWPPPPSPWLPPLPDLLPVADLPACEAVVLGLVDEPDEQRRTPLTYDPSFDGSLLIAGGQRSGRTTALRTLLAGLAGYTADELHVHLLDCAGGGIPATAFPHCGTTVGRDDTARGSRLLTRLVDELDARRQRLAAAGLGSLVEWRGTDCPPQLVLVLDGWEGFVQAYEPVDTGRPVEQLLRLAREGAAAGIVVVATSDRNGLGIRLAGVMSRRIVLPLTDRADYPLAGIPARVVPTRLPPGRGLLPGSDQECQVAIVGDDASGAAQNAALAVVAARCTPPSRHRPLRIAALPSRVCLDELPRGTPRRPWLGVGGDDAAPIALDLDALGSAILLAGPPRSGRTSTLTALAEGLVAGETPVAVVTARRSPLRTVPGLRLAVGTSAEDAQRLREAADLVVLADDIEALLDTPVEAALIELVRADGGSTVIGAGRTDDLAGAFRGLGVELRRRRTGVLLCPSPPDGELLGIRLPRGLPERDPGRGWLVADGTTTRIQVATPGAGRTP